MDDEIVEALHERPLRHPAIEKEHDRDDYHMTQESTSQEDDEIKEDLAINDPSMGMEPLVTRKARIWKPKNI